MNTLCWSLTKPNKNTTEFSEYVIDMYYLSMVMAKQLGYRIVFYGNSVAIEKLRELCDEIINIDNLHYEFYDDIKVFIWETRRDDYVVIDGDVFLYKRLLFRENFIHKKYDIRVDTLQQLSKKEVDSTKSSINLLEHLGISKKLFEWNYYKGGDSYCTGIIHWNNTEFKEYYIQQYYILRKFILDNRNFLEENIQYLKSDSSILSHILCEQTLYKLMDYYNLNADILAFNDENSYTHIQGSTKFRNPDVYIGIGLLVRELRRLRKNGFTHNLNIKQIYVELAKLHNALQ